MITNYPSGSRTSPYVRSRAVGSEMHGSSCQLSWMLAQVKGVAMHAPPRAMATDRTHELTSLYATATPRPTITYLPCHVAHNVRLPMVHSLMTDRLERESEHDSWASASMTHDRSFREWPSREHACVAHGSWSVLWFGDPSPIPFVCAHDTWC